MNPRLILITVVIAVVIAAIFYTPLGLIWVLISSLLWGIASIFSKTLIDPFLWILGCLIATIFVLYIYLRIRKH